MKKNQPIIIALLLCVAAVAGVYFLWYKPKKDKEEADQKAAQAAKDAELSKDDPKFIQLMDGLGQVAQANNVNNAVSNIL